MLSDVLIGINLRTQTQQNMKTQVAETQSAPLPTASSASAQSTPGYAVPCPAVPCPPGSLPGLCHGGCAPPSTGNIYWKEVSVVPSAWTYLKHYKKLLLVMGAWVSYG